MIKKFLQKWARRRSFKQAVATADKLRAKDFKKYFVIFLNGEFRVYSKQALKYMHKQGVFKRGINYRQVEKLVYYTTK